MNPERLKAYRTLYTGSESMGSARMLREYLQLERDLPVPLSISHGVDLNQSLSAIDVHSALPIHWSYNQSIHERALRVKPSIKLPHPWMMLKAGRTVKPGSGALVIAPPPSNYNDKGLLNILKQSGIVSYDLLIKYRGATDSSFAFWESNGVKVVSAGLSDDHFYDRLFDLLASYEYVIGCTLSSALVFAAAIGKKCKVVEGFTYKAYDVSDYLSLVDFNSPVGRQFTRLLSLGKSSVASTMALDILGYDLLGNAVTQQEELRTAIENLKTPVHFSEASSAIERSVVLMISNLFGKTGLIQHGIFNYLSQKAQNRVSLMKIDELDIWLNGMNERNCQVEEVDYIKGVTEPGYGAD